MIAGANEALPRPCEACGYDLRNIPDTRCPECGRAFDPAVASRPRVAWYRRDETDLIRAFVQTVWTTTWHPADVREAFHDDVQIPERDARLFAKVVVSLVALAAAPAILASAGVKLRDPLLHGSPGMRVHSLAAILLISFETAVISAIAVRLIIELPRVIQSSPTRKAAFDAQVYFAAGPLAWLALMYFFVGVAAVASAADISGLYATAVLAVTSTCTLAIGLWWRAAIGIVAEDHRPAATVVFACLSILLATIILFVAIVACSAIAVGVASDLHR